ncbi:MAG: hypothetical protein QOJ16_4566 [Acidobacteriota bacterium]|nr:hypothetical protein [Acidobacteriota bacterium]
MKLLLALGTAFALTSSATAAAPPPRPVGLEIAVNDPGAPGRHSGPQPALFSDGGFVVVWTDTGQSGGAPKGAVHARFFHSDGTPSSGEFRLIAQSASSSVVTSVVADVDDSFLVAWDDTPPGKPTRVLVQRFSRTGKPVRPAFQVHAVNPRDRSQGRIALRPGGGFVVAWTAVDDFLTHAPDVPTPFYAFDVDARAFTAGGVPLSPEFVARGGSDDQILSDVAVGPDGVITVLYTFFDSELYVLRLGRSTLRGRQLGDATRVSSEEQDLPVDVAALSAAPDGSFTVAWTPNNLRGEVLARRFAAGGSPMTADLAVDSYRQGGQKLGHLAALPDGGFVAVWTDNKGRDGSGTGIFGRPFGADGQPLLPRDFRVNLTTAGDQFAPVIVGRAGRYVVAWNQSGDTPQQPVKIRARLLGGS